MANGIASGAKDGYVVLRAILSLAEYWCDGAKHSS